MAGLSMVSGWRVIMFAILVFGVLHCVFGVLHGTTSIVTGVHAKMIIETDTIAGADDARSCLRNA